MATDRVLISPGVFTSEKSIQFVQRQVGVTTLGLAGETEKGPAFEPMFISDYREYMTLFGGLNPTKERATEQPLYELPYIAKSYLTESNQLFVTRVLGFSGYDAGYSWGITLDGALKPSTSGKTCENKDNPLIEYTADTENNEIDNIIIYDSLLQYFYDQGFIDDAIDSFLITATSGDTFDVGPVFDKPNESESLFTGVSSTIDVLETGDPTTGTTTGTTSGVTICYSGDSYHEVEDRIVALLRSKAFYDADEILNFQVSGSNVDIVPQSPSVETNPLATFKITGTSRQGDFEYPVSFNENNKNYIERVFGKKPRDTKAELFIEELYQTMMNDFLAEGKVRGINVNPVVYGKSFFDYEQQYQGAVTPFVVSEVRGNKIIKLFRFHTISDGNAANEDVKVSITNIAPDKREFNVVVRSFYDRDENPQILEQFARCTMNRESDNFIGKRIGTLDGEFQSQSQYITVELEDDVDFDDAFPAGFLGYPVRDYEANGNDGVQAPQLDYKLNYNQFEKKRKFYLGISDTVGIDQDIFDYKGEPEHPDRHMWTGMTPGFHLDKEATGTTVEDTERNIRFKTSDNEFKSEFQLFQTQFENFVARKFTFAPYGGFDGWDIYRKERTNGDLYRIDGAKGELGLQSNTFEKIALSTNEDGITSDFYAFFEGIRTFSNPEQVNVNVFATPGIDNFDNTNLVEETIDMMEDERRDSLYIMTTPDVDRAGTFITPDDMASFLDRRYDTNYAATYWPWVQVRDSENNQRIYLPPTRDVVRDIAFTDNVRFPWFAVAGVDRGDVDAIKPRKVLTLAERDTLYEARVNPIAFFPDQGIKIWGNKTMQIEDTALNRVNVRRLLLQARKLISSVAIRLLFDQNDDIVRNQFLNAINPILDNIRSERGLEDFKVELSDDPEERDRLEMNGTIFIKPVKALEYINIQFVITPSGAEFDEV